MKIFYRLCVVASVLAVIICPSLLRAQTFSERFGRQTTSVVIEVVDEDGTALPGVELSIDTPLGTLRRMTDGRGEAVFSEVPAGEYEVTATLLGFGVTSRTVKVSVEQSLRVRLTLSSGGGPGPQPEGTFTEPIWNVWAEASSSPEATYRPVAMRPNSDYSLVVNLAAIAFADFAPDTVFSHVADESLRDWIDAHPELDTATVDVVLIPDRRFFGPQPPSERFKRLEINLAALRELRQSGFELPTSPFKILRDAKGKASFSFGTQTFRIRTRAATGLAGIGISIWINGKPVDELSVGLCIPGRDQPCEPKALVTNSLRGVDLGTSDSVPDAALHLLDRPNDIAGVFYCNKCGWEKNGFKTWAIEIDAENFAKRTSEILDSIAEPPDPASGVTIAQLYERAGQNLANIIFDSVDPDVKAVRQTLSELAGKGATSVAAKRKPPTLFVRLIPSQPDLILVPVNLMHLSLPDGRTDFLGYNINVRSPLEFQDYSRFTQCVDDWTVFVPPVSNLAALRAVSLARVKFDGWIKRFRGACTECIIDSETGFDKWLKAKDLPAAEGLIILSHHASNALFFYDGGSPSIPSSAVARDFAAPSLVIISACGSGKPGAVDFIHRFNARGARAIIATSTDVDASMGGAFLTAFLDLLSTHAGEPSYTITDARFDAVRAIRAQKDSDNTEYGPRTLTYLSAGSTNIRACLPREPTSEPTREGKEQ